MNHYELLRRYVKPVHIDNLFPIAGQHACVSQQSYGHDATGKQEIQDFTFSSASSSQMLATTSVIDNDENTSAKIECLFQYPGKRRNTYYTVKHRRNWTSSHETYQNAAKREYELLLANYRHYANYFVTLKYFKEFTAGEIRTTWSSLKELLIQRGIVAYSVVEITTRPQRLPNGVWRDYPTNRVHYHILVDTELPEPRLRRIFNRSCVEAGLSKEDFEVHVKSIPNRRAFVHKCKYVLKYANFKDQAILFQPNTGINKICSLGRWFINADGSKMNKDKTWGSIVAGWYQKKQRLNETMVVVSGVLPSCTILDIHDFNPTDVGERNVKMTKLFSRKLFRLYGVSDSPNENEEYLLEAFNDDAFNEDIDVEDLNETLTGLADATYGQGSRWHEIIDDHFEDNGKVCIEINDDDRLEIQDITDKIATDSEHPKFYILVDAQLSDYCWVVAESKGVIHSG